MAGIRIEGNVSGNVQEVDASNNAQVTLPGFNAVGVAVGGGANHGHSAQNENDTGELTGAREVRSAEVDDDYRYRVGVDTLLDQHDFCNDTAQYTSKFAHAFTTLTATQSTSGLLTNSGGITTTTTGMTFGTHAMFRVGGTETLVIEQSLSFSAQPNANQIFDIGGMIRGAATAYAPLDGVHFRISSAGVFGVANSNGSEAPTSVFPLFQVGQASYTNDTVYRLLIQVTNVRTTFWCNNFKLGELPTPIGLNFPCMAKALPWGFRHAIVGGAAGAVMQVRVRDYRVFIRGPVYADSMSVVASRVMGSYQGLNAATIGTLGTYTNSTNPAAAVPTNTTLAVGAAGLLNQAWETFSLAVNTDGILQSYQVPAGTATVPGRRYKVVAVKLASFVQTVLAGGPCNRIFTLCFGHTAVSLATAESASFATGTTKARRVVALPELTQAITAAQAVSTVISQPGGCVSFLNEPVFVNPGEFIQVAEKIIGTVGTSGTIVNFIQVIASPE